MHNGAYNQFTRGRADEVAVYDRALSAAEVDQHFRAGSGSILPAALHAGI
jgi:hypothetical protein